MQGSHGLNPRVRVNMKCLSLSAWGCLLSVAPTLVGALLPAVAPVRSAFAADPGDSPLARIRLEHPILLTQLPCGTEIEKRGPVAGGMLRAPYGARARILLVRPDGSTRVLSRGFHGACDPRVSFDAKRFLFAGKRTAGESWNIYEMDMDGTKVRRITGDRGDCRSPCYQSTLYTIISPRPWYQITFVGRTPGILNEYGSAPATNLYSCRLDGTRMRRLTFNLSSDLDPWIMDDGRLLYAGWQRRTRDRGVLGRIGLFGINIDGTDQALFAGQAGKRIQHMPCTTAGGLAVFIETDSAPWDGAGAVACVRLRRPLHSHRWITRPSDGLFHSPSPLPDGRILVSRRPLDGSGSHGVYRLDPSSGEVEAVFDDPRHHDIQARLVHPRSEPDGRSSVVTEKDPHGKLYCLNVYTSDLEKPDWMPRGTVKRLRVLEGIPIRAGDRRAHGSAGKTSGRPPLVRRRILGEVPVKSDGSFNLEVPANTPLELQILDADGLALRSCGWIWTKNHESRGCIGCHEDGELTPENRFVEAVSEASVVLCPPPARRRTVEFRRDVMPILTRQCASCHRPERFGDAFIHPGRARTSPMIWQVFGSNTSRPWDGSAASGSVICDPTCRAKRLTPEERRTLVEWIDTGAHRSGLSGNRTETQGARK
jgi:hypothetical protein